MVYELAQIHAGDGVSLVICFISSDVTMVSKKMGGRPIIRKCLIPIGSVVSGDSVCIRMYPLVLHVYLSVYVCMYMY